MSLNTCIKKKLPIYDPLIQRIKKAIEAKEFAPGQFIGSENDLAIQEGLSRVSIRRAVSKLISDGLIERRPGKGLYVRSPEQTTQLVQVVVPSLMHDQWIRIVQGAQSMASECGTQVLIADAHANLGQVVEIIRRLPQTSAQGAILPGLAHPRYLEVLIELKTQHFPMVLVDQYYDGVDIPSVTVDNKQGGYIAGTELLRLGHRKIGFIGAAGVGTVRDRLEGLRNALNDAGIAHDRRLMQELLVDELGDWSGEIEQSVRNLLSLSERPTAIFCTNDAIAAAVYHVLRDAHIRVPEEMSVVGFDDNTLCKWLHPLLTTVAQPSELLGRTAMQVLMDQISGRITPGQTVRHVLPVSWVARNSVLNLTKMEQVVAE